MMTLVFEILSFSNEPYSRRELISNSLGQLVVGGFGVILLNIGIFAILSAFMIKFSKVEKASIFFCLITGLNPKSKFLTLLYYIHYFAI